jgi:hypothetical protein
MKGTGSSASHLLLLYHQRSMEYLPKNLHDGLLIVHFEIDRAIPKRDIDALVFRNLIVAKHPKGWMTTSLGRDYVKRVKR